MPGWFNRITYTKYILIIKYAFLPASLFYFIANDDIILKKILAFNFHITVTFQKKCIVNVNIF